MCAWVIGMCGCEVVEVDQCFNSGEKRLLFIGIAHNISLCCYWLLDDGMGLGWVGTWFGP